MELIEIPLDWGQYIDQAFQLLFKTENLALIFSVIVNIILFVKHWNYEKWAREDLEHLRDREERKS